MLYILCTLLSAIHGTPVAGESQSLGNLSVPEPSYILNGGASPAPLPEWAASSPGCTMSQVFMKPRQISPLPGFFLSAPTGLPSIRRKIHLRFRRSTTPAIHRAPPVPFHCLPWYGRKITGWMLQDAGSLAPCEFAAVQFVPDRV